MRKCDVVIPVYKSPEWVELCLYALFQNTGENTLNKVYLINDSDDTFTKNCLKNLKAKYGDKIIVKQNKKNIGFTGTANIGIRLTTADFVLLLNTDCLISKNTIEKLMAHMQSDEKIGLICPISSNAANLSLDILEGFTYTQMNELLEKRFMGKIFDACTVVGNCLMISRECIKTVGLLDEIYAPGYGEETDYQFAAMKKGFSAKVAIDTYVFHKAETSFGISDKKRKMIDEHLAIFFSRWGEDYDREMAKYRENDPVKYILDDFEKNPPSIKNSAMFYMMNIGMSGGCNVVVDIINRLAINGYQCNILYESISEYPEFMLFSPVPIEHIDDVHTKRIVATLWVTVFLARKIAIRKKWELIYFVQGLEQHFEDGRNYGSVETTYKISNNIITVSKPLQAWIKEFYGIDSQLISNGINLELLKKKRRNRKPNSILLITRNDYRKCNYVIFDILKKVDTLLSGITVNLVISDDGCELPILTNRNNHYNIMRGPFARVKIFELMQESNIYIDTSCSEGFGLTALESMAAGCIPIVSDSFGVRDYVLDKKNGLLVKEINNADAYIKRIRLLMQNEDLRDNIYDGMAETVEKYDFNDRIQAYKMAFCDKTTPHYSKAILDSHEKRVNKKILNIFGPKKCEQSEIIVHRLSYTKGQLIMRKVAKVIPKPVKICCIKAIEFLRSCY